MPATRFEVVWPNGEAELYYSPSTSITEHLEINHPYAVEQFEEQCEAALNIASERVKEKYGFYCSSAMDQLSQIKQRCKTLRKENSENNTVLVTRFIQE
ncbi:MSMEG_0570 family nitrogen starvation response protein [Vibrio sp. SCSIO 43169]|uniref:MSMEG_0570 family nitrogen starvation response protein n=1 Tax=Vibrio sp. SCSIO 43169 TaxID=2822801 RepID=UPI002042D130|nr:MSMEG_0570 family nitrogen starvation response protein [Vibrio sp. SCSIO 43169]MCM5511050.1 MSMEG_0570 family nitrogen starvation response protein [Vibrio sp. SCSIO 43169]